MKKGTNLSKRTKKIMPNKEKGINNLYSIATIHVFRPLNRDFEAKIVKKGRQKLSQIRKKVSINIIL